MRIARSIAQALAEVLIERVASVAALISAPTWSTPGRPVTKRRSADSEAVTSPSRLVAVPAAATATRLLRASGTIGRVKESELRHREVFRTRWAIPLTVLWVLVAAYVVFDVIRAGDGHDIVVALALVASVSVVIHATATRPAVVIDDAGILLRNIVRDIYVPWSAVEDIDTEWVLTVHTSGRKYVAWAVSARNPARQRQAGSSMFSGFASPRLREMAADAQESAPPASGAAGQASEQVVERWLRWRGSVPAGAATVTYRWELVAALAVALLVLAGAVALG